MIHGRVIAICLIASAIAACAPARVGGTMEIEEVNNALREENYALREQVQQLQSELARQAEALQRLESQAEPTEVPGVKSTDLPVFTKLRFGRYSGAIDTNNDNRDDTVRIYLLTLDQYNRFLPVVGAASIQLVHTPAGGDPQVLARRSYDADDFRAAYRSGFLGTHYTLELALPARLPAGLDRAAAIISVTDAATGRTVTHQEVLALD